MRLKKCLELSALLSLLALAACSQDGKGDCITAGAVRRSGICDCPEGWLYLKSADACIAPDASTSSATAYEDAGRSPDVPLRMDAATATDAGSSRADTALAPGDGGLELGATCTGEGRIRCPMAASALRQRCEGGIWSDIESCGPDQVCDDAVAADAQGCRQQAEVCLGNATRSVCDGATMIFCDARGTVQRTSTCGSERQCELGLAGDSCALCVPGTLRCQGAALETCEVDGSGWVSKQPPCSSAALCNEEAGACTSSVCLADSKKCAGDVLQRCNDALTAFEDEKPCGKGLCDMPGKQCDVCVAGTKSCDGNRVSTCDEQGQAETSEDCPDDRPVCTGSGKCVQCAQPSDCPPASDCTTATCNVAAGTCGTVYKTAGTTCAGGVCDGKGGCGPAPRCGDGVMNQRNEECDDGNLVQEDDCRNDCKRATCGDGLLNRFGTRREECDLTAGANEWSCTSGCKKKTIYNLCTTKAECAADEICATGICTKPCEPFGAVGPASGCPSPPGALSAYCNAGIGICQVIDCASDRDCLPGQECRSEAIPTMPWRTLCAFF